ncbi:MAG: hypothetical protein AMXMBFR47_24380 [Planctomycetota bacterium]
MTKRSRIVAMSVAVAISFGLVNELLACVECDIQCGATITVCHLGNGKTKVCIKCPSLPEPACYEFWDFQWNPIGANCPGCTVIAHLSGGAATWGDVDDCDDIGSYIPS